MRFVVPIVSVSLFAAAVVACTTETVYVPSPTSTAEGGASVDAGSRPPVTTARDGGLTSKTDAGSTGSTKPTTCAGAAKCLGDCEGQESSCTDKCYGGMSDAELKELQAISLCIADSGCSDDECVATTCAAEIEACLAE